MTDLINKLRGGYYTPREVAQFICEWAITSPEAVVLEPSCGDGAFVASANQRLTELGANDAADKIIGIELYQEEANKAKTKGGRIACGDFFTLCKGDVGKRRYDAIVGNPPFIRYQDFEEEFRTVAFELLRDYGFSPNRLTNIWLPFLVVCCHLLTDSGRLGMVIPAELFQVKYAAETRHFLMDYFESITVITFTELLFDGVQQEVILLLAQRTTESGNPGVRMVETKNSRTLKKLSASAIVQAPLKRKLPDSVKWQAYYLENKVLGLLAELANHKDICPASDLFEVNVGVVSGQNSFFVIDQDVASANRVTKACVPIISRSFQLDGLVLTDEDFERLLDSQRKVLLFLPDDELNPDEHSYVQRGEELGVNQNFKCRTRSPWYKVPTSWVPDAFFYRQVGSYPRIVINEKHAQTTDTLHKIRFIEGVDGRAVAVAFNNSYTFVSSELAGRSYGGGVLTFEPSEARDLPIPFVNSTQFDFEKANALVRQGRTDQLVAYVDELLLVKGLSLSKADVSLLHKSWHILRDRRLARKKR